MAATAYSILPSVDFINTYSPVEMPKELMLYAAQQQKKERDSILADTQLAKDKLLVPFGPATQQKGLEYNQTLSNKIDELGSKALETGNYQLLTKGLSEIKRQVELDPTAKALQLDAKYGTEKMYKDMSDPKFKQGYASYLDEQGQVKQLQEVNPQSVAGHYQFIEPKDWSTGLMKDAVTKILPQIEDADPTREVQVGADGKMYYTDKSGNSKYFTEDLVRSKLRENNYGLLKQLYQNLPGTDYGTFYKTPKGSQRIQGETPDEILGGFEEDIIDSLRGRFYETPSKETIKTAPGQGGKTGRPEGYLPNPFLKIVAPSTTTVTHKDLKPLFEEGNKKGSYRVEGGDLISNFSKTLNIPKGDKDKLEYLEMLTPIEKEFSDLFNELESQNLNYQYTLNPSGEIVKRLKGGSEKLPGKEEKLNAQEEEILAPAKQKINSLKEEFKSRGINVDDPKVQESLGTLNKKYQADLYEDLKNVINIPGDVDFYVSTQTKNKFNVDNKMFVGGKAIFTKDELDVRFAQNGYDSYGSTSGKDWGDIFEEELGIIKPYGGTKEEPLFAVDIKVPIELSKPVHDRFNLEYGYTKETVAKQQELWDKDWEEYVTQPYIEEYKKQTFKEKIAKVEGGSEDNPESSAVGKYQHLWNTHKDKIKEVTGIKSLNDYKNNSEAQEKYQDYLIKDYEKVSNKIQNEIGTNVDKDIVMALIHSLGESDAKLYIKTLLKTKNEEDAQRAVDDSIRNRTKKEPPKNLKVSEYLSKFAE